MPMDVGFVYFAFLSVAFSVSFFFMPVCLSACLSVSLFVSFFLFVPFVYRFGAQKFPVFRLFLRPFFCGASFWVVLGRFF